MDQSPLLALPDDALLAVLAYLPPIELLSCRVLCRRLRDLCLHPDLWRRVRLNRRDHTGLVRAAIRLAPCLRALDLTGIGMDDTAAEVSRTSCVVGKLTLGRIIFERHVTLAAAVLEKLSALGGLLELVLVMFHLYEFNVNRLLRAMYKADRLRRLTIYGRGRVASSSFDDLQKSPSLTELTFLHRLNNDPLLEHLLTTHAATLEHVRLIDTTVLPMSALRELPRLRSLSCETVLEASGLPGFFRAASQLRCVSLLDDQFSAATLPALGASLCAPVLETLKLDGVGKGACFWRQVAAAVPQFTSLRTLSLTLETSRPHPCFFDFLSALNPSTVSGLTTLEIIKEPSDLGIMRCAHAFLHQPAVDEFLKRNPRLHLRLENYCWRPADCACSNLSCHSEIRAKGAEWMAVAAHFRAASCPSECFSWL